MDARHATMSLVLLLASCGGAPPRTERTVDGRAEVEVVAIPVGRGTDATGGPNVDPDDPGTFPRDQPAVRAMMRWNGRVVVRADALYALDLDAGQAHPLTLAGADEVLGLAMQGPTAVALVRRGPERLLFVAQAERWVERALPEVLRAGTMPLTLAADASSLALYTGDRLHRLRGTTWSNVAVGPPPREPPGELVHAVLAGDRLFLGWDGGERGGGLLVFDARSAAWSLGPDWGTPVSDIERAADGTVWAATGVARFGALRGALHHFEGEAWTTVAACGNADPAANRGWTLPADSFQSIAFAPDGSLAVLTGALGVVRRDATGVFHQRTRRWPAARYLYVRALELEARRAVIASADAGVWVWDLGEEHVRRITLGRPGP